MQDKLRAFYCSQKWERFLHSLRLERMQPDGSLICEHCGRPIVSKYDCIGHHVTELTEENVDDVMIALNPENVILIHFKCHNDIHHRFGFSYRKQVFIVYGAPCSGKSTWVQDVADKDDLILDIDKLWSAIRAEKCGAFEKPNALKQIAFDLRDCILDDIRTRRGKWCNAYIIGGYPMEAERTRLADSVGADKLILIDTSKDTCMERAAKKSLDWCGYVLDWFERYSPPSAQ